MIVDPIVSESADQQWAYGCSKCKFGIVAAPALTRACELYMERMIQHIDGQITYCDCRAGTRYRVYLLNRRQILIEEARRDPRMERAAARLSHPDIEAAQRHILHSYEMMPPPTVHLEVGP